MNKELVNVAEERVILGRLLLSPDSFFLVADVLKAEHFAVGVHQRIYGAIRDILMDGKKLSLTMIESRVGEEYDDGKSTMILMTGMLRDAEEGGDLDGVDLIVDLWRHRQHIAELERALKEAKKPNANSADLIADHLAHVDDITSSSQSRPFQTLGQLAQRVALNSKKARETGVISGFDTGLPSLDQMLGRIHRGDLGVVGARQGDGKGQALDADVLTPFGYRKMGDLKVGDLVCSPNGSSSRIIGVYPLGERQLYRVSFIDGTSTEVTDDHIWLAWIHGRSQYSFGRPLNGAGAAKLFTTSFLMDLLKNRSRTKIQVPVCEPVQFTCGGMYERCPIPPYTLGALLGDGSFRHNRVTLTSADPEIVGRIEGELGAKLSEIRGANSGKASSYLVPVGIGVRDKLAAMGLMEKKSAGKFIPKRYLKAGLGDRWALLQGLMDTDGTVSSRGDAVFDTKSRQLAEDVAWLARSLGAVARIRNKATGYKGRDGKYIDCGTSYSVRLKFRNTADAFFLERKRDRGCEPQSLYRTIVSIEPSRIAPAQCIKVSDPSSLYMTNDFIVTHNTIIGLQIANWAEKYDPAILFEYEMDQLDLAKRALAARTSLTVSQISEGSYDFDEAEEMAVALEAMQSSRCIIEAEPKMRLDQIRNRCLAVKRSRGLGLVVIDHLRLIRVGSRFNNKFDRIEHVTGELKSMAKDLDIAVIVLSQVTRASQRDDKHPEPGINDLDGGSSIEQDADWILGMFRRDRWLKTKKPYSMDSNEGRAWVEQMHQHRNKIEIAVLKRRRGEDGEMREFEFDGRAGLIREL